MKERRMRVGRRVWLLCLVPLFVAACTKTSTEPAVPTTINTATLSAPETVTVTVVPEPTPTATAAVATATLDVPPMDLCRDYLDLSVLYGETELRAVPTSYRCHNAHIDSTGQSPGPTELVVEGREGQDLELPHTGRQLDDRGVTDGPIH